MVVAVRIFLSRGLARSARRATEKRFPQPPEVPVDKVLSARRIGVGTSTVRVEKIVVLVLPRDNLLGAMQRFAARHPSVKSLNGSSSVACGGRNLQWLVHPKRTGTALHRCGHLIRGLGPRQMHRHMHRRHAHQLAVNASMVAEVASGVIAQEAVAARRGLETIQRKTRTGLQGVIRRGLLKRQPPQALVPAETRDLDSVAQAVSYTGIWGAIRTFPMRHPFLMNFFLSVTGYAAADYSAQCLMGGDINTRQTFAFAVFGAVQGCVAWGVFVRVFSKVNPGSVRFSNLTFAEKLRDKAGQLTVLKQVVLDNFVYTPLMFFPIFYFCKAALLSDPDTSAVESGKLESKRYATNFFQDNWASCKLWIPADLLIFTVPAWMRMPVFQGVSFAFTMVLSRMRGSQSEVSSPESIASDGKASPSLQVLLPLHWTLDLLHMSPLA